MHICRVETPHFCDIFISLAKAVGFNPPYKFIKMKKLKIIGLTIILMIGFIIPSCDNEPLDSCDGVVFRNYFDV